MKKKTESGILQFVKFGLVGLSNTIISEGVYFFIVLFGGNYLAASVWGFILSVLNAYFWSSRYVFKEQKESDKRVWWKVLLKTYAAYFWGFLVNAVLLVFWIEIVRLELYMHGAVAWFQQAGIAGMLKNTMGVTMDSALLGEFSAPLINMAITIPMNFIINKYWAYKQAEPGEK